MPQARERHEQGHCGWGALTCARVGCGGRGPGWHCGTRQTITGHGMSGCPRCAFVVDDKEHQGNVQRRREGSSWEKGGWRRRPGTSLAMSENWSPCSAHLSGLRGPAQGAFLAGLAPLRLASEALKPLPAWNLAPCPGV